VQEIFVPIRDLGVNRPGALSLARPLCAGQGGFQVAVKALGLLARATPGVATRVNIAR